jgi:hypothetical protein
MKTKIIVVLFIAITFLGKAGFAQGNDQEHIAGLKMIISTDKSVYLEGEIVWQELLLIIDKKIVKLDYAPHFGPGDVQETVINSKNQGMPSWEWIYDSIGNSKEYPDTMRYFSTLNIGLWEDVPNSRNTLSIFYFPADEYEFSAFVSVVINGKIYKIKSEPVKFTVLKPEGDEALARQAYLEILSLTINSRSDFRTRADKVNDFLKKFPNSIYIDQVLRISRIPYFIYYKKTIDERIAFYKEIIEKYPGFASNYERLTGIMTSFEEKKDLKGYRNFIEELKSKHKDNSILNKVLYYHNIDFERELRDGEFNNDK